MSGLKNSKSKDVQYISVVGAKDNQDISLDKSKDNIAAVQNSLVDQTQLPGMEQVKEQNIPLDENPNIESRRSLDIFRRSLDFFKSTMGIIYMMLPIIMI